MIRNILAATGVVLLVAFVIVASPAMGKALHNRAAITDPHFIKRDIWHPDTKTIA